MSVLRWLVMFPIALIAAWLVYRSLAIGLLYGVMGWWISPSDLVPYTLIVIGASVAMGIAYVSVGVTLAPSQKAFAAAMLCWIGVLWSGGVALLGVLGQDWPAVANGLAFGLVCAAFGYLVALNPDGLEPGQAKGGQGA